jgi:hypothetical protein
MPSPREAALMALYTTLTHVAGAAVERDAVVPERIPAGGLLILRDGEPGEPEITLSPLLYHYDHAATLDVLVQAAPPATRALALDGLLRSVAAALAADRTLGGTIEWLSWSAPRTDDLAVPGGAGIKGAVITIVLTFSTPDPLI